MSSNRPPSHNSLSSEDLLRSDPNIVAVKLESGASVGIPQEAGVINVADSNRVPPTSQSLQAVIGVGGRMLSVVKYAGPTGSRMFLGILNNTQESDGRASMVGGLSKSPLNVRISGIQGVEDFCAVWIGPNGEVCIQDLGTETGTTYGYKKPDSYGLDRMALTGDIAWSIPSGEVREHISRDVQPNEPRPIVAEAGGVVGGVVSYAPRVNPDAPRRVGNVVPLGRKLTMTEDESMAAEASARERAREAAKAVDIERLTAERAEIELGLSETDQKDLWLYAVSLIRKADAQNASEGEESILQTQIAGQAYDRLSPSAQAVSRQYLRILQNLDTIKTKR